ncbi:glycosyltransferase family 4 protein [Runella slithyformis]|uniref:Glycosyl transferase group 1 n=1 Tax=Runella slithyformis (strain ATCC 29530 / DSM 19594 / LMG 11500 / NCIMB 11436 / LSU 4) TaxID=761193 RepID=A0A7U4E5G8_RUNSL|nr:glycosyltransferase family 4 protein [Runella slithyformis]AEI48163.1 glycosyl transferase group 1 [Runella slithyformis DSM 19594]
MPSSSLKVVVLPDAGAENPFQYELVRYLRKHGMQVVIGKKYTLGSTFRAMSAHHPDVIYYDWVHSFILGKSLWWSWLKSLVFVAEIVWAKSIRQVRVVHTLHNLQNHAGIWLGLEKWVYRFFLHRCEHIRVYSETTKQEAISRFGLRPAVISVIQDLPYHAYYPNDSTKQESRQKLSIDKNAFVFLFFGEMKPYKGLHQLIKAYSALQIPNTRLLMAGKSYDADYWKSLMEVSNNDPDILWHHRFIEDSEVQYFFNAADVVVLPFTRIDHSGSIDLAMSFGKPIITLRTDGTAQLLSHQLELLFDNTFYPLEECLSIASRIDLAAIGKKNFEIADTTNYRDMVKIFEA